MLHVLWRLVGLPVVRISNFGVPCVFGSVSVYANYDTFVSSLSLSVGALVFSIAVFVHS